MKVLKGRFEKNHGVGLYLLDGRDLDYLMMVNEIHGHYLVTNKIAETRRDFLVEVWEEVKKIIELHNSHYEQDQLNRGTIGYAYAIYQDKQLIPYVMNKVFSDGRPWY